MSWCRRLHPLHSRLNRTSQLNRNCRRTFGNLQSPLQIEFTTNTDKLSKLNALRSSVNTDNIREDLLRELICDNRHLTAAATHLFTGGGKYFRPTCVMLMGGCCNHGNATNHVQREIALITELIHVASLVHDDVLDSADTRRTLDTVNSLYNDKVAILSGDYIIARATSKLARLGCSATITILSSVIRDLIKGEILQLNRSKEQETMFEQYLEKTYLKTASLVAHSCQAAALNSSRPHLQQHAFQFGRHLGIAFQLVDDMLDFISSSSALGKAAGSDLKLGLATAPVLYASTKHPQLLDLVSRGFTSAGDVELACQLVEDSSGIEHTRSLAGLYCEKAVRELGKLPDCQHNSDLETLCEIVLGRTS